jgi:membrane associated rhomboid family serine protease
MAANVVFYVLELILLRANVPLLEELALSCAGVFDQGKVWQVVTYWWLHDPSRPTHLIFNMVWLWMFGAPLEKWWGAKRFITGYAIFGLGGAALTLLVGLLSRTDALAPIMGGFWTRFHMGASGAVMGITVAWGLVFANQTINLLFLGEMKGKTFLWITIAFELLVALSFDPTSSTSHFGGMAAAFVVCRGLWRPAKLKDWYRRVELKRRQKKIEHELRIIDGGKDDAPPPPKDKKDWN